MRKDGRELFRFEECPYHDDPDGHTFECCVMVGSNGQYSASCKHEGEAGWIDFKKVIKWDEHIEGVKKDVFGQKEVDKTQTQILLKLTEPMEAFKSKEGRTFISYEVNGHIENCSINSKQFNNYLYLLYFEQEKTTPNAQSVSASISILNAQALKYGKTYKIFNRIAFNNGAVYIDIGDDTWRAVKITKYGREIVKKPNVKFVRNAQSKQIPIAKKTNKDVFNELRILLGISCEKTWTLYIASMFGVFNPNGPYPVLVILGNHGSGKSTASKVLKFITDPANPLLRSLPSNTRDLMIAAFNSWFLCFDNLSRLKGFMSDALCRLTSGEGFSTRELYSDADEFVMDLARFVLLNGISEFVERPDLLDRATVIFLAKISDTSRKSEHEIWKEVERLRPYLLAKLFDAVSEALRNLPNVKIDKAPRLYDFCKWVIAAEKKLGFEKGKFLQVYMDNRNDAQFLALENSIVASTICDFMKKRNSWNGTATKLLEVLQIFNEDLKRSYEWPRTANSLSAQIKRLLEPLKLAFISIEIGKKDGIRFVQINKIAKRPSKPSRSSNRKKRRI